jgi:hypothetical protein
MSGAAMGQKQIGELFNDSSALARREGRIVRPRTFDTF